MATRNTLQQKIIADRLCEMHNHPTADEVYQEVSSDFPTISKATVYRVLNKMAESGQVLKVPMSGGADHFDDATHAHCHVVCTSCGRVDDVDIDPELDGIDLRAEERTDGYQITGHEILFHGICPACRARIGVASR